MARFDFEVWWRCQSLWAKVERVMPWPVVWQKLGPGITVPWGMN